MEPWFERKYKTKLLGQLQPNSQIWAPILLYMISRPDFNPYFALFSNRTLICLPIPLFYYWYHVINNLSIIYTNVHCSLLLINWPTKLVDWPTKSVNAAEFNPPSNSPIVEPNQSNSSHHRHRTNLNDPFEPLPSWIHHGSSPSDLRPLLHSHRIYNSSPRLHTHQWWEINLPNARKAPWKARGKFRGGAGGPVVAAVAG